MRTLRLVPLLALSILFLAACTVRIEQKGPTGPWVGEVTNNSTVPALFSVEGHVLGADGHEVYWPWVETCPDILDPGETGGFEFVVPSQVLTYPSRRCCPSACPRYPSSTSTPGCSSPLPPQPPLRCASSRDTRSTTP